MTPRPPPDPRTLEALSAYLDGRLKGAEKSALEDRLQREEDLRRELAELRAVRDSLRALPPLKPPRSLLLSRKQVEAPSTQPGWPGPRRMVWGSALAALAFVVIASFGMITLGRLSAASKMAMPENAGHPAALQAFDSSEAGAEAEATQEVPAEAAAMPAATPPSEGLEKAEGGGSRAPSGESTGTEQWEQPTPAPQVPPQPAPESNTSPFLRSLVPYVATAALTTTLVLLALLFYLRRRS